MAKVSIQREKSHWLILPTRQLNAALRKSADRAQRLAAAFGKTVPGERAAQEVKASAGKSLKKPASAR
jgi:hypothetical protein